MTWKYFIGYHLLLNVSNSTDVCFEIAYKTQSLMLRANRILFVDCINFSISDRRRGLPKAIADVITIAGDGKIKFIVGADNVLLIQQLPKRDR
jgi:hypothetical protein